MERNIETEQINLPPKRSRIGRRILKITLWTVGSIVGLVVVLLGVVMLLLTPSRLTPIVNDLAGDYLNAKVHFANVDVSLWRDFPRVSLGLDSAVVISYALDSTGRDTLARFERLYVSLDAMKLLDGDVDVRAIRLVGADLSGRVDSTGRASWEIYATSADTTTSTDTTSISINVEKLIIEGRGRARYVDQRNATDLVASFDRITAHQLGATRYAVEVDLGVQRAIFDTVDYDCYVPLTLRGGAQIDYSTLDLDSMKFDIGVKDALVRIAGRAQLADSLINSDLTVDCSDLPLERIVNFIPIEDKGELAQLRSNLQFGFALSVNGSYNLNNNHLPQIKLDLKSNNGGVKIEGRYLAIEHFAIDATVGFEPSVPQNNYIDLRKLDVKGNVGDFSIKAKATQLLGDYHVEGSVDGRFVLSALNYWMPKNVRLGGVMLCHVDANVSRHQLKISKIGKAKLGAKITFDSVRFADDSSKVMLDGFITAKAEKNVFIFKTEIDTINFDDRRLELSGAASDLRFATGIKAEEKTMRDSMAIYPFGGSFKAARMNLYGDDSTRVRLRDMVVRFSVIPAARDNTIPRMQASIESRSLSVSQGPNRIALGKTKIKASTELLRSDREIAASRKKRLDSLQRLYPDVARADLAAHSRKVSQPRRASSYAAEESDMDLNPGKTVRDLMRRWRANGELSTKSVRISTPFMPLRTRLTDLDLMFNNDSIMLRSMKGKVGRSDISISGEVTGLRRAIQSRGVLRIDVDMKSDTLDVNQLIKAGNAGLAMLDQMDSMNFENHTDDEVEQMIAAAVDSTAPGMLVMIPKNVAIDVRLEVENAIYGNFVFDSLKTSLISRNKVLQINELSAGSEIGKLSLHAIYETPTKYDITTSADLELLGVDVGKLIAQIPEIDTILPMLASFEGVVDVRAAAKSRIDSNMNVVMPSLDAVATLKGKNLVLLDGQTFAEISKMLSFKNKKRNVVDSISVEMKVVDEKVEFFPFIITLDRYKAAVSGNHGMDMEFDYHISVLKSIIPFRVGIDIKGNLDDWDFKITHAKYKSEKLPSYTMQIDSMRINLRNEILGVFDKLNRDAQNAPDVQNR